MASSFKLDLVDAHAGGDVSRQVLAGVSELPGDSLLDQLEHLRHHADGLRQLLLFEPYGDPAMCVNLVVPAKTPGAAAGFITMESMGYPYFSGSNTLCTAAVLMQRKAHETGAEVDSICLETPAGLVTVSAQFQDGRIHNVSCRTTPAYVVAEGMTVELSTHGQIEFDLVFSGALYAVVKAQPLGLTLSRAHEQRLIDFAHELVMKARPQTEHDHPEMGLLAPLPFVHFEGPESEAEDGVLSSPSATYVFPDVICRSPTGTGTTARLALARKQGRMQIGDSLRTTSPRGNSFLGVISQDCRVGSYEGIVCEITGRVFVLSRSQVVVNFDDHHVPASGLKELLNTPD